MQTNSRFQDIIAHNSKKTMMVLLIYCAIFVFIGLLVDIIRLNASDFGEAIALLLSFQILPIATIIMFLIALGVILFSLSNFTQIMLSGQNYKLVDKNGSQTESKLYKMLESLVSKSDLNFIPKLYIIDATYLNAFASGWSEKNAIIALSSALVEHLDDDEIKAVMAHELSHILHGDIKLTMVVGILGNIMLLVTNFLVYGMFRGNNNNAARFARMILLLLQFVLPIITLILQNAISRNREYMADSGAAYLLDDPMPMVKALQKIQSSYANSKTKESNPTRRYAYIFDPQEMFSTHPTTQNRINSLLGR